MATEKKMSSCKLCRGNEIKQKGQCDLGANDTVLVMPGFFFFFSFSLGLLTLLITVIDY